MKHRLDALVVDLFGTEALPFADELNLPKFVYIPTTAWRVLESLRVELNARKHHKRGAKDSVGLVRGAKAKCHHAHGGVGGCNSAYELKLPTKGVIAREEVKKMVKMVLQYEEGKEMRERVEI
nr:anthocyanidin 3-O-glucosyltransferase 5-like [Ipomoea batatas]GMD51948.1 anthocyanidin 3-O-glucosyltransferase 5-like [Ipomoea batatas]GMD54113.1 anthocyanidin 3-O-glucosyltransferase 5-like [Ipomoea batatas]